MFNNIKRVAAVIALTGWLGVASATFVIVDFSYGTNGNELVGEITGLNESAIWYPQKARSIIFTKTTGVYAAFNLFSYDLGAGLTRDRISNEFKIAVNNMSIKDVVHLSLMLTYTSELRFIQMNCTH
jgi:hypothetical protein